LVSLGVDVSIYNIIPTKDKSLNNNLYGIHIFYPKDFSLIPSKISIIIGLIYTLPKVIFAKKPHVVYSYGFSFIQTKLLWIYKYFFDFKLVKELNEYPLYFFPNYFRRLLGKLSQPFDNKGLDAIVVISNFLKDYYAKYISSRTKVFILNMIVDLKRFDIIKTNVNELQIVYCGSFNNHKDGILYLIKGYSKFLKISNFKTKLYLIGKGNKSEEQNIDDLIEEEQIKDSVIKLGLIRKDDIPYYLINASVLILPRPDSIQAKAGSQPNRRIFSILKSCYCF
jgi:hypothetical protein